MSREQRPRLVWWLTAAMWVSVAGLLTALVIRREWDLVIVMLVIAFSLFLGERMKGAAGQSHANQRTESADPARLAPGFSKEESAGEPNPPPG